MFYYFYKKEIRRGGGAQIFFDFEIFCQKTCFLVSVFLARKENAINSD